MESCVSREISLVLDYCLLGQYSTFSDNIMRGRDHFNFNIINIWSQQDPTNGLMNIFMLHGSYVARLFSRFTSPYRFTLRITVYQLTNTLTKLVKLLVIDKCSMMISLSIHDLLMLSHNAYAAHTTTEGHKSLQSYKLHSIRPTCLSLNIGNLFVSQ